MGFVRFHQQIAVLIAGGALLTSCSLFAPPSKNNTNNGSGTNGAVSNSTASNTTLFSKVGGDSQTTAAGTLFVQSLVVSVRDQQGLAIGGAKVNWSLVSGSASLASSSSTTWTDGNATMNLTAGTTAGPVVVKATLNGTSLNVTFNETVVGGPAAAIILNGGNAQTGAVATVLPTALSVQAKDQYGNNASACTIDWVVTAQGGSMGTASSACNLSGVASDSLTLGTLVGTAGVTATLRGTASTVNFTETAIAGPPTSIAISSGNNQSATKGTALASPFVAIVKDTYNNVCPGVTVNWAVASGGGSLSSASNSTTGAGLSSSTLTLGPNPGANSATATVNATALSVTFNATGLPVSFTQSWPFNLAGAGTTYTYTSSIVDFPGSTTRLKTVDQLDDDNSGTGFGGGTLYGVIWDGVSAIKFGNNGGCDGTTTNCATVAGASLSGKIDSRIIDVGAGGTSAPWTSLAWTSNLPYGKELPGSGASESSANYPAITASLMNGNVALWHLNEAAAGTVAGGTKDFLDSSSTANHGTGTTGITYGNAGVLGSAPHFDGTARITFTSASVPIAASNRTVALWFKQDGVANESLFSYGNSAGFNRGFELAVVGGNLIFSNTTSNTSGSIAAPAAAGVWHHAAATYDGTNIRLYLDGALQGTTGFFLNTNTTYFRMASGGTNGNLVGYLDEVGIWNRQLSTTEINELYQRGATHIGFQVRSCAQNNCSDGTFVGPDGTASTYFTEISNGATTSPSMLFSNFSLSVSGNRYFQYRAVFDTTSSLSTDGPLLRSVTVGPNHYQASTPTVSNQTPQNYYTLSAFNETLGGAGCSGGSRYLLSRDNLTWYYWTGAAWGISDGSYSQASSASVINTNISTFPSAIGIGNLYWKVFLKSDATSQCEIDDLTIQGAN